MRKKTENMRMEIRRVLKKSLRRVRERY